MDLIATIRDLRSRGASPRVHPNGFIQLDISEHQRIHYWPAESLPRPEVVADLHDHVYAFRSCVLLGKLHHIEFSITEEIDGDLRMVQVPPFMVHRKTIPVAPIDDKRYRSRITNVAILPQGAEYRFEARQFHRSLAEGVTATLMTCEPYDHSLLARVMCRVGQPDPIFVREAVNPESLWAALESLETI